MSRARRILDNIASNSAGYLVSVLVALLLSPYVVAKLGDVGYGIWTVLISLTGYYGLLDLGIRSALGHYLAAHLAKDDRDAFQRTFGTAWLLMWGVAAVTLLITVVLVIWVPRWYTEEIPTDSIVSTRVAIAILGLGLALQFPRAVHSTAIYARQRIDLLNLVGISERVVVALGTLAVLSAGGGLVGLAVVIATTSIASWVAYAFTVSRIMPGIRARARLATKADARQLMGYGGFSFLTNACERIVLYTDTLLVSFLVALAAVTYYAHALNIAPYYIQLVASITWSLTPYATEKYIQNDYPALQRLLLKGTRLTLILSCTLGGGLILLGSDFIALWQDPKYVSGSPYASSGTVLAVLAAALFFRTTQSVGRQILFATREVKFLGYLSIGEATVNLAVSFALVRHYGLIGVAMGTLVSMVLSQGIIQPAYTLKRLDVDPLEYLEEVLRVIVPMGAALTATHYGAAALLGDVTTWWDFILRVSLVGGIGLVVGVVVGTKPDERDMLRQRLRGVL